LTNPHALIVDDDLAQRTMLASMLRQLGCTTSESSDPTNALRMLGQDESFNIVFTDVLLPGMSGVAFLARVRERFPMIPVVVLSASDFDQWGQMAMAGGASFCLQIPFFKSDLLAALQAAQVA
jgi:two-component system, NtrC family, nitrogen regulation response regulator GlnG